ncbi:MAG: integrase core domain-containing protein [Gemmatimonadota bacterium]|nr:integrase core domain-containing protein [Gemmatimonadota bacterium]
MRAHMGGFGKAIALGLGLRQDWVSQYRARQLQAKILWLGIRSKPGYVGEPECNGVAERFIRMLKEECIYLHHFETLGEAGR